MAVSYNRLYKVLEDKNVTMVELRKAADIAPNTMTRIRKNEEVSLMSLAGYVMYYILILATSWSMWKKMRVTINDR